MVGFVSKDERFVKTTILKCRLLGKTNFLESAEIKQTIFYRKFKYQSISKNVSYSMPIQCPVFAIHRRFHRISKRLEKDNLSHSSTFVFFTIKTYAP
jgi:hypothetical protein